MSNFQYELTILEKCQKQSRKKFNPEQRKRIAEKIYKLRDDPEPYGSVKLRNVDGHFRRIRMEKVRVVYEIIKDERRIVVTTIDFRKDVYKALG